MNKLKINFDKSKFMVFSYGKKYSLSTLMLGNNNISITESIKFLGITIDQNLNFRAHTSALGTKIAKVNGLLFRLNNILPCESLKLLYSALLVPHIVYGIEIWHGALETNRDRIFKLQKKAIRAINSLPYNHHTHDYFKSMNLLKSEDLYKLKLSTCMFKNRIVGTQSDVHAHNTRHQDDLILPRYNRSRSQTSWMYQGICLWNSLPNEIKLIERAGPFKNSMKRMLLENY